MKGTFMCPICIYENSLNSFFESYYNNDEISKYKCPHCNKEFLLISKNDKYRILFDSAIILLQDGHCNNSILNAYTSLEEFIKIFIKFKLYMSNIKIKDIIEFMKSINLSENKKGAFFLAYFQEFNTAISKSQWDKFTKLRNDVIHNGRFINEQEAFEYCEEIYDFITKTISKLSSKYTVDDYRKMNFAFQKYYIKNNNTNMMHTIEETESILPTLGYQHTIPFQQRYDDFKMSINHLYNYDYKISLNKLFE